MQQTVFHVNAHETLPNVLTWHIVKQGNHSSLNPMNSNDTLLCHVYQCHYVTTSHPDIEYPQTRKPRFYHVTNVTPCTCASLAVSHHITSSHPDIEYPQTRKPRFYHVTNVTPCHYVTPCTCVSLTVPHHVTSSHPDIEYHQTRKPRFYHVTNVTPCTCHYVTPSSHPDIEYPQTRKPCPPMSPRVPHLCEHVTSSHPDIEYHQTRKPRFYHVTNVTPCHYVTPCTCATLCHNKPP